MGCQSEVELEKNLTFSICTHDPDTGVLTDADAAPSYRVYEDETGTAILSGNMAKLDDANTTGFYSEQIACTAANGFEANKTYTVYIEATVDSDTGGISYGFRATSPKRIQKNAALANFEFVMTDNTNHAPSTGLSVTAQRSIDGAAFGACANAVSEVASGIYAINLAASDLNGDVVTLRFTATNSDDRLITIITST